jgi:hypothetical protein
MKSMRIFAAVFVLMLGAAIAMAGGYVVVLKSGHMLRCREPMKIDGPNAIITLVTGVMTSYPLDLVDIIETERYNKQGLGDALLIQELSLTGTPVPTPTPRQSLGHFASIDAGQGNPVLGSTTPPTATPTPGIKLQTVPYHDERVDQAFAKVFDDRNLYIYRTSAGTKINFFFVQTVTDTQREVFEALSIVCEAYSLIHNLHEEIAPAAVELQMIQTSGKPAGTFRLTPELAEQLAAKQTSVEQFYVNYVIF